jgi:hypothetical protein
MLHVFSLSFHTDVNRYMWCVYKHIDEPTQQRKGRTENLPQDMMWHGWKHELLCCTFV